MAYDAVNMADWQISEEAEKNMPTPEEWAEKLGLAAGEVLPMGRLAKLDFLKIIDRLKDKPDGKYIEVTAITPTPLGEGKTLAGALFPPPEGTPPGDRLYRNDLSVKADGSFYINLGKDTDKALSLGDIRTKVAAVIRRNPDTPVLVWGDVKVPYGKVVTLMSELQAAGAPSVGLVTENPPVALK